MSNLTNTHVVCTPCPTQLAEDEDAERAAQPSPATNRRIRFRVRDHIPAAVFTRPDMRARLSERDIAGVYRLLHAYGVSQRAIAARTGQSQSEVSEIFAGRRQVIAYDVLVRIADGLGVPRGWMGLADDQTASLPGEA